MIRKPFLEKVLVVAPGFDGTKGGVQRYSQTLYRALNSVCSNSQVKGIEINAGSKKEKIRSALNAVITIFLLRPQLVICTHVHLVPLVLRLRGILKFKVVVCCHGVEVWNIKRRSILHSLQEVDEIWPVSAFTELKIQEQIVEVQSKSNILPNTINAKSYVIENDVDSLREEIKLSREYFIFLTVNRFERSESFHSYEAFLPVFERINQQNLKTLWICIGGGNDYSRFQRKVEISKASDSILLTGRIPDQELQKFYRASDVFVMPSKLEGFGIVYLEAAASGLYCIGGNQDGAREVIFDPDIGFTCYPDDEAALEEHILTVMKDSKELLSIDSKKNRRKKILIRFGLKPFKKNLKQLLEKDFRLD